MYHKYAASKALNLKGINKTSMCAHYIIINHANPQPIVIVLLVSMLLVINCMIYLFIYCYTLSLVSRRLITTINITGNFNTAPFKSPIKNILCDVHFIWCCALCKFIFL